MTQKYIVPILGLAAMLGSETSYAAAKDTVATQAQIKPLKAQTQDLRGYAPVQVRATIDVLADKYDIFGKTPPTSATSALEFEYKVNVEAWYPQQNGQKKSAPVLGMTLDVYMTPELTKDDPRDDIKINPDDWKQPVRFNAPTYLDSNRPEMTVKDHGLFTTLQEFERLGKTYEDGEYRVYVQGSVVLATAEGPRSVRIPGPFNGSDNYNHDTVMLEGLSVGRKLAFYKDICFDIDAGRYGASESILSEKEEKKNGCIKGADIANFDKDPGAVPVDGITLSHNFEFRVYSTGENELLHRIQELGYSGNVAEQLFAVHAGLGKKDPWDIGRHDVDISHKLNEVLALESGLPYEVKQNAKRQYIGISTARSGASTRANETIFHGLRLAATTNDEFWILKLAFDDKNNDKQYDKGETVFGLQPLHVSVGNKSADVSAVAIGAYALGVATGVGITRLGQPEPPTGGNGVEPIPEEPASTYDQGTQGSLVE